MTIDFIGYKTKRLTVLEATSQREQNSIVWRCKCRCGNIAYVSARSLNPGIGKKPQQSCGKCGDTKHELYSTWIGMIARCERSGTAGYEYYGGRGIKVCDRWKDDFLNFVDDMGPRPKNNSIDRIDVNGNYEPNNCRWATNYEQAWNKNAITKPINGKLTDQDLVDIYHSPKTTPVQYIAEKFNISIKSVRNIRCAQHSREKMLKALAKLTPRSII